MEKREWLIAKRGERTQEDVALTSGVSRPLYTQIETGKRNPSVPTAQSIAATLGFEWTIFFEQKGFNEKQKLSKAK